MKRIIACLVALSPGLAYADGFPIEPPLPLPPPPVQFYTFPRHLVREGQYFFCPYAEFDPWCTEPDDYSWNLYGPPWRQHQPVISVPVANSLTAPHVPFAAYGRPPGTPPPADESMDSSRERIIQLGEEHCRKFPQDTQVCHPAK